MSTQTNTQTNDQIYPISTTSHIIIALSLSCLFWIFFAKPTTYSIYTSIPTIALFAVIIPIVMIIYKTYENSINGNEFILIKLISIVAATLIMQGFIWSNNKFKTGDKTLSIVLIVLLIINILEAVASQLKDANKTEIDGINEEPLVNIINPITGILLSIILVIQGIMIFKGQNNLTMTTENNLILKSNLSLFFILGYTFWNLLFRIQLVENTFVFAFFCVSLVVPIISQYTGAGDWLQIRALSLLFILIIAYGFTNEASIFPVYNKLGYDKNEDSNNPLTKIQQNREMKLAIMSFGIIFTLLGIFSLIYKIKNPDIKNSILKIIL